MNTKEKINKLIAKYEYKKAKKVLNDALEEIMKNKSTVSI